MMLGENQLMILSRFVATAYRVKTEGRQCIETSENVYCCFQSFEFFMCLSIQLPLPTEPQGMNFSNVMAVIGGLGTFNPVHEL
jgi:hypothetical protein